MAEPHTETGTQTGVQTAPRPTGDNPSLEEIEAFFKNDRFAALAGCTITEGSRGHAVCEMPITEDHLNAQGGVMGGAIFTLADFTLAIASNVGETPTVLVNSSIDFMSASKGTKLIATCDTDKSGKRLGFYRVSIVDDTGRAVARLTATCAHL